MGKPIIRLVGISVAVLVAYMAGAHQGRIRNWLSGHGYFQGVANYLDRDRGQKITPWIEKLKKGGYILFMRHAHREKWPEVTAFDLYELASKTEDATITSFKKAVCLSEQGIEEAKIIGKTFQLARMPVGFVVSSPSCRAKQTAVYAFGRYDLVDNSIRFTGLLGEKVLKGPPDQLLMLLRTVRIVPGTNTIISGHSINLGPNGLGGVEGDFPGGNSPDVLETGFYVIERGSGGKLRLAFSFKSISELATHAINIQLK